MTRIFVLLFFLLFAGEIFSQDLAGEWIGHFSNRGSVSNKKTAISISLVRLNDSTYHGKSITIAGKRLLDTTICTIEFTIQEGNGIIAEEKEVIKSPKLSLEDSALAFLQQPICLQKMKLRFKNNTLSGSWKGTDEACGSGPVLLSRKE